jgi:predicted nucleic acid-binding protein
VVEPHPSHARAYRWLEEAISGRVQAECTWHAVAETWSVLTRIPLHPAISPALAEVAIGRLLDRIEPVELTGEMYGVALRRCAERSLRSGVLFDALHLACAESREAAAFVTLNPSDFERLRIDSSPPIVVPPDPPAFTL